MVDNFSTSSFPWVHTGTFARARPPVWVDQAISTATAGAWGRRQQSRGGGSDDRFAELRHRQMSTGFAAAARAEHHCLRRRPRTHFVAVLNTGGRRPRCSRSWCAHDDFSVDAEETIAFDRAIGPNKSMLEQVRARCRSRTAMVSVQADKPSGGGRRRFALLDVPE